MDEKLKKAVAHALQVNQSAQEVSIARARMRFLGSDGFGIDAKRPMAWCEFGFPERIESADFVRLYKRGGLAHGAVGKLVSTCWRTAPELIDGDKQDKNRAETRWEKRTKAALPEGFWPAVEEADKRRLVCRYSALILRIRDSKTLDQPVRGASHALVEAVPVWAGALKIREYYEDPATENYGQPKMWQYTETRADGSPLRTVDVHPDRIVILGDWSADAVGFLEPAYNAFVSLEKVEGGSGESFLKNAARQLAINFAPEVDLNNLASMYGVNVAELQDKFNEAAREINRGNDTLLITQGANTAPLVSQVPDPNPTYSVNLQTAAAALDIPTKIMVGMQTGERASSEDQKYWMARCQSRRVRDLGRDIRKLVQHLMRIRVLDAVEKFSVLWDDLTEAQTADKLANGKLMSDINNTAMATGAPIFTDNEIRTAAGFEPLPGGDVMEDVAPKDDQQELDDGNKAEARNPAA